MRAVPALLGLVTLVLAAGAVWLLLGEDGGERGTGRFEVAAPDGAGSARDEPAPRAEPALPPERGPEPAARTALPGEAPPVTLDVAQDAGEADAPAIRGRVVDGRGEPVAGARILAARNERRDRHALDSERFRRRHGGRTASAETDGDGRFELSGPRPGLLRVAVRAEGFAPFDHDDLELPPEPEVDLGELVLEPGIVLAGRVVDPAGVGVAGAELLSIAGERDFDAGPSPRAVGVPVGRTDGDGRFRVDRLAPGPWKLLVRSEAHPDHVEEGIVERGSGRLEGVEIRLASGGELAGFVSGERPGALVVRATPLGSSDEGGSRTVEAGVGLDHREAPVGERGEFVVRGLVEGWLYELSVRARDEARRPVWLAPAVTARVGDGPVELALRPAASVAFRVLDAAAGEPVEDFQVWLASADRRRRLDAGDDFEHDVETGLATLEGLHATGDAVFAGLEVRAPGYWFERRDGLRLAPGARHDLGTIALTPLPVVLARVRSAATGEPVFAATVHVACLDREARAQPGDGEGAAETRAPARTTTTTDPEGVAFAPGPPGATLHVWATHPDHAPSEPRAVRLDGVSRPELSIRLGKGATARVLVRDAERRPLAGRVVQRQEYRAEVEGGSWQGAGGSTGAVTDADGRARFELLRPGLHRFGVVPPRRGRSEREWKETRLSEGEEQEVVLDAPALFSLGGRVAEAGFPLAGARVWLHPGHERSWRLTRLGPRPDDPAARTGADGRYEIRDVPTGDHLLVVSHPARAMDSEVALGFESPGSYAYDVELPITRVSGRVVDPGGRPLEGIEIAVMPAEEAQRLRDTVIGRGARAASSSDLERTTATDGRGRFEVRGVVAEIELVVVARGRDVRTERSDPFVAPVDGVRDGIEIVARSAGTMRVTVTRADGSPARDVAVHASYRGPRRREAEIQHQVTDSKGRVLLDGLAPGPWRVRVVPREADEGDDPLAFRELEVEAGKRSEVAFELP